MSSFLKAHVCQVTGALAPKIHNLVRLAEIATLPISSEQHTFLGRFNQHQLEGRYPGQVIDVPQNKAKTEMQEAEKILKWLITQL